MPQDEAIKKEAVARRCAQCRRRILPGRRIDTIYCSDTCRQRAHRARLRGGRRRRWQIRSANGLAASPR